jgi:hypothetical protein
VTTARIDRRLGLQSQPVDDDAVSSASVLHEPAEVSWASLGFRARAWRIVHAVWSVAQLVALAELYRAVARRRRGPRVWASAAFLLLEGAGLLVGRGDCPMGRVQEDWGDPKPFFELLLPPRAAKAAVPILGVIAGVALAGLAVRRPGLRWRA